MTKTSCQGIKVRFFKSSGKKKTTNWKKMNTKCRKLLTKLYSNNRQWSYGIRNFFI